MARVGLARGGIGVKDTGWSRRCAAAAILLASGAAQGYDGPGHSLTTQIAVAGLPAEVPGFFRGAGPAIAGGSMDPDVFKIDELPQLRNAEYPEHYFDLEPLKGQAPPALRYQFLDLCAKEGIQPSKIGTLPYALAEWTQRLTLAFADCRRFPDSSRLQAKCVAYAGILAHYAEDATQPLHTTIDYDGRTKADGKSPRSGIHAKVDALIEKIPAAPAAMAAKIKPEAFEKLWPAILEQLDRSHALVDKTYELEPLLPGRYERLGEDEKVIEFGRDRLAAAAQLAASLYLTAWRDSARLPLPDWHVRELAATEGRGQVTGDRGQSATAGDRGQGAEAREHQQQRQQIAASRPANVR
jgi:hypothetical protein